MRYDIPEKCDVVVVGGGPAGTIASGLLAKKGIEVVLIEKKKFPRNTVGESLIPQFWRFTDLVGASPDIEKEGFIVKKGGIVHWEGKTQKVSFKPFGFDQPALHVERDTFDHIMLNVSRRNGVQVFEEVKVQQITLQGTSGVFVSYQDEVTGEKGGIQARYVIDASGQQAILANQEKTRDFDRNFAFQAVWGYFDQSHYFDQNSQIRPFADRMQYSPLTSIASIGNWGWSWHILLRQKVSVGIVIPRSHLAGFKAGGKQLEDRLINYVPQIPMIRDLLAESKFISGTAHSVRDYAYRSKQLVIGNCFLVGDAAAFVDPISSEGVPMAMYGGYLASWAVLNCLKKVGRAEFYQKLFKQEYQRRLEIFKMLAFPSHQLPETLLKTRAKIIGNFSEQEIRLIMAQAKLTGRESNFYDLFAKGANIQGVPEVETIPLTY